MSDGVPDDLPIETRRALEAIVMVAPDPVPPQMLAQLLEISVERVEEACATLAATYEQQERGFVPRTSAAIVVLLAFLITMNAVAIYLRKKFERRW